MSDCTKHIWTITKRELGGYFMSPVAYVFIVIFLLLNGFFTFMLGHLIEAGEASLMRFFMWHPWIYMVFAPAVGMRLWSEERRMGTMELLLTMPITPWQAIVGKFLASWVFMLISLVMTFPVVLTVRYLGAPDMGTLLAGYLGSILMAGGFLAVTSATSAVSRSQVVSLIISVVACFFLILIGWEPVTRFLLPWLSSWMRDSWAGNVTNFIASFSVMPAFMDFQRGLVNSDNVVFFLCLMGFPLFLTGVIIRNLRAG